MRPVEPRPATRRTRATTASRGPGARVEACERHVDLVEVPPRCQSGIKEEGLTRRRARDDHSSSTSGSSSKSSGEVVGMPVGSGMAPFGAFMAWESVPTEAGEATWATRQAKGELSSLLTSPAPSQPDRARQRSHSPPLSLSLWTYANPACPPNSSPSRPLAHAKAHPLARPSASLSPSPPPTPPPAPALHARPGQQRRRPLPWSQATPRRRRRRWWSPGQGTRCPSPYRSWAHPRPRLRLAGLRCTRGTRSPQQQVRPPSPFSPLPSACPRSPPLSAPRFIENPKGVLANYTKALGVDGKYDSRRVLVDGQSVFR